MRFRPWLIILTKHVRKMVGAMMTADLVMIINVVNEVQQQWLWQQVLTAAL